MSRPPLLTLEVVASVLQYFPITAGPGASSGVSLARVSKVWHAAFQTNALWSVHLARDFGMVPAVGALQSSALSEREFYYSVSADLRRQYQYQIECRKKHPKPIVIDGGGGSVRPGVAGESGPFPQLFRL